MPPIPGNHWGLFGQVGGSRRQAQPVQWSVLAGIGGTSPLPRRDRDKFGLGFFYVGYSSEFKASLQPRFLVSDEYGGELFYDFAITPWFRLTADSRSSSRHSATGTPPSSAACERGGLLRNAQEFSKHHLP